MDKYSLRGQVFQEIREDILNMKNYEKQHWVRNLESAGRRFGKHSVSWSWRGWFTLFRTKGPM